MSVNFTCRPTIAAARLNSGVVLAAGFKFHLIPTPVPQAAESPDPGAVFDPIHGAVLTTGSRPHLHQEEGVCLLTIPSFVFRFPCYPCCTSPKASTSVLIPRA